MRTAFPFAFCVALCISMLPTPSEANTGKVVPFELPKSAVVEPTIFVDYDENDPILVKIRYPIGFGDGTQAMMFERMKASFKSGRAGEVTEEELKDIVLGTMITNTIYHAFELYDTVSEKLPEGSVVLSPQTIELEDGRFVMKPVIPNGAPPALVDMRFFLVTDPHRERVLDSDYLTFADAITPSILVTEGFAGLNSEKPVLLHTEFRKVCNPSNDKTPFLECMSPATVSITPTSDAKTWKKAWKRARVKADAFRLDFPINKLDAPQYSETGEEIEGSEYLVEPETVKGSFYRSFDDLGKSVATYAAHNWNALTPETIDRYYSSYASILTNSESEVSSEGNIAAFNILAENLSIEKQVLFLISDSMRASTYDGEYGDALRQTVAFEAQIFEKRRAIAREQRTGMFVGLVTGALVGASGNQSLMNTFITTAMNNSRMADAEYARSRELMESFNDRYTEAYGKQLNFSENEVLREADITADDYGALRAELAALYSG